MVKSFLLGIALSASAVCFAAQLDGAPTSERKTKLRPPPLNFHETLSGSTPSRPAQKTVLTPVPATVKAYPVQATNSALVPSPVVVSVCSAQPVQQEYEYWQYARRDQSGGISVPWSPYPLDPYEVFVQLKDDSVNQSQMPRDLWDYIENYAQYVLFTGAFVTKTNEICLPNSKNALPSREAAHLQLLALWKNGYDLRYFIAPSTLRFLGLLD